MIDSASRRVPAGVMTQPRRVNGGGDGVRARRSGALTPIACRGRGASSGIPVLLYVHPVDPSFIRIDRDALAARWEIESLHQPGRVPRLWRGLRGVLRADLVFGWWASWHTFFPVTLAWLLRKPSVLIIGGFDTASVPS